MRLFDGHLDMALNALDWERDQTWPVEMIRRREAAGVHDDRGTSTVSLPELKQGGTAVVVSTVIARAKPWVHPCRANVHDGDWPGQSMAYAVAMGQLAYYRLLEAQGHLTVIETAAGLAQHLEAWDADEQTPVGLIVTMEGADPIVEPDQVHAWHAAGLRTLMLAHFGRSHYAHGTPTDDPSNTYDIDGPLSDFGRALLPELEQLGMPLDLTHTSDKTFAEAADRFAGRIYSSHTGCRAVCNLRRNHTDEQLKIIIERNGVVGLPIFNRFLLEGWRRDAGKEQATIDTVLQHIDHLCQLAGSAEHVAIGSDFDGGFGREHIPAEMDTHRDLRKLADALAQRGYSPEDIALIMGGNWERFYAQTLP